MNHKLSDGNLGWQIREIQQVNSGSVTFEDGISFSSPCFSGATVGDIWAVKYEPSISCFGEIHRAIFLENAENSKTDTIFTQNLAELFNIEYNEAERLLNWFRNPLSRNEVQQYLSSRHMEAQESNKEEEQQVPHN